MKYSNVIHIFIFSWVNVLQVVKVKVHSNECDRQSFRQPITSDSFSSASLQPISAHYPPRRIDQSSLSTRFSWRGAGSVRLGWDLSLTNQLLTVDRKRQALTNQRQGTALSSFHVIVLVSSQAVRPRAGEVSETSRIMWRFPGDEAEGSGLWETFFHSVSVYFDCSHQIRL